MFKKRLAFIALILLRSLCVFIRVYVKKASNFLNFYCRDIIFYNFGAGGRGGRGGYGGDRGGYGGDRGGRGGRGGGGDRRDGGGKW